MCVAEMLRKSSVRVCQCMERRALILYSIKIAWGGVRSVCGCRVARVWCVRMLLEKEMALGAWGLAARLRALPDADRTCRLVTPPRKLSGRARERA